jgi:hypothetical protein
MFREVIVNHSDKRTEHIFLYTTFFSKMLSSWSLNEVVHIVTTPTSLPKDPSCQVGDPDVSKCQSECEGQHT